jgi:hypothetical protein
MASSLRWETHLSSYSPSRFPRDTYTKQKGKRNVLVPNDVTIKGRFELSRFGSDVALYQLLLTLQILDGMPIVRSVSLGLTEYATTTDRYKRGQLEPSLLDEDLKGLSLQTLAALIVAKVSLTNKIDVTYVNDYDQFVRDVKQGKQGLAFGDKPEPVFTDDKGVSWYKVFTYDATRRVQGDLVNAPRRTASRPTHKQVAEAYKEAKLLGKPVNRYLQDRFSSSDKSVERWIRQAKDNGYLDETKQGRPRKEST